MNILISHTSIYRKAGWGRIFPLAVGLAKLGNKVTILTTNPDYSVFIKKLIIKDVHIVIFPEIIPSRVSKMGFGLLSLFLKIIYVLFHEFDVVHSDNGHRPLSGIPCRIHKRLFKSVYVAEWYDWYGRGGQYDSKKRLFKILLGHYELKYEIKDKIVADGVVVLSEILRKRAELYKTSDRIIKIHGGADVSGIQFLKDNSSIKRKFNISRDTVTLGYINSDSYRLAELLPLINVILKYNLSLNIKIIIFGEYRSLISQLPNEVKEMMVFFGWIDYTKDYEKLQLVDVFFLFKEEMLGNKAGWPNCIGDYLACGRPILLNPVGEVKDFARKYPIGFIECTKEETSIYDSIQFILEKKEELADKGTAIRILAEEVVSWEKKSTDLFEFYKYLLGKKETVKEENS